MTTYVIHCVSRGRHNRTDRAQLPANPRMKHHIGHDQRRLVRGRPLMLPEELLLHNLEELKAKAAAHILEVRTTDGRLVDLSTLEAQPLRPESPRPSFKLDSVNDDKPAGQYIPPYVGDDNSIPQIMPPGEKPSLMKQVEEVVPDDVQVSAATVVATDDDLNELLEAAQTEASDETSAPSPSDAVSSKGKTRRKR